MKNCITSLLERKTPRSKEITNEISIRGEFDPQEDAWYYFTCGFKVSIPVHLLESVPKALTKLIEKYGNDSYDYSFNHAVLEFEAQENFETHVLEDHSEDSVISEEDGIANSFSILASKKVEIMELLQLPDNEEWAINMGINGCY
ncbi:hypothetical protein JCM9140_2991 [Halalkalibacter wakoensis JCM 9140]|uniref:Uncharacterized protein n=1 Tax=Halalkalibacter wakoensis JCM 9140 TaxID=1236970 RepID=W4Q4K3_9BACI|nr:hypothetical protein [Halalkalibacter wakoensis]GAE26885.1 hypothetical protein JCM9140_2991 [Halalkalibacter wakoensis JCM 9140]